MWSEGGVFGKGRTAATGGGITVVSDGSVAYGNGVFVAAHNQSDAISIGEISEDGGLMWSGVHSMPGKVRYISFAYDAFFATSRQQTGESATLHIARSTDGIKWKTTTFMGGALDCGSVACLVETDGEEIRTRYCAVGNGPGGTEQYDVLFSAISTDGESWGSVASANPFSFHMAPCVGAGKGAFVTGGFAAGTATIDIEQVDGSVITITVGTAQAQYNRSTHGTGWSRGSLPVPGGSAHKSSFADGAVFVDPGTGDDSGNFVMAVNVDLDGERTVHAMISPDGRSWSSAGTWPGQTEGLSIVGKELGNVITF